MASLVRATGAFLCAFLIVGELSPTQGQPTGGGRHAPDRPVVRPISPQAYDGSGSVWDVAQDGRGLLYIASSYGLQQYDGARWRYLRTENETTPWAVARDTAGILYVGARNELGYYRPDSMGRLTYRSLMEHVPARNRPVGNVRSLVATDGAVYFGVTSGVLRWADGRMLALTDTTARALHACRDTVYVRPQKRGSVVWPTPASCPSPASRGSTTPRWSM